MNFPLFGQILGFLATALFLLSYQARRQLPLILIQTGGTASICLSYLFLGAGAGFALNIVSIVRNLTFCLLSRHPRLVTAAGGVLAVVMGAVGVLSWQGPLSLLMITALMANTVCMSFGRPQLLRASVIGTSSLILVYNVLVGAWGGMLNEGLSVISSAVGIVRFLHTDRSRALTHA